MKRHVHQNVLDIAAPFKGILLDAYGVFWGGNKVGLLPGSLQTMQALMKQGKIVGILSNSTQLAAKERDKVHAHGLFEGIHFHFFVTSGEISRTAFMHGHLPFPTPRLKFWIFGKPHPKFSSPQSLFEGSPYQETQHIHEADFIFVAIPHFNGEDQTNPELFRKDVRQIMHSKLPMVCANPDRFAHEGNPPQMVVRQGAIAALYEGEGGQVFFIGKPGKMAFNAAMQHFQLYNIHEPNQILMVGDTPETDIKGARAFGMSSALIIKTGIMAEKIRKLGLEASIDQLPPQEHPHFLIEHL